MVGWNDKLRKGVHPVGLGWVAQLPRVFIEACDVIQAEMHECDQEQRAREAARGR